MERSNSYCFIFTLVGAVISVLVAKRREGFSMTLPARSVLNWYAPTMSVFLWFPFGTRAVINCLFACLIGQMSGVFASL